MKKALLFLMLCALVATPLFSQIIAYQEDFSNGELSLNWFSIWSDSLGNPYTPMIATNEPGPTDDWIGVVTGDMESLGSLGGALAGNSDLADYSIEAKVFVSLTDGYYEGLMMRCDTTDGVVGYQMVSNFNPTFGASRVRFRYFSEDRDSIRTLLEVQAADLPGGVPTEDGYHSMKIKAVGNQFWLYWDGQEISGSPVVDPKSALDSGYFGVYVWNAFGAEAPAVKVDDVVVRHEGAVTETFSDGETIFNWFSTWNDSLGNPYTPMVPTNEVGPTDDWIGVVTGDLESLGSLGGALAGDPSMSDYSIEAQVFVSLTDGYYEGLMMRCDTTDGVVGYQMVSNFNPTFGASRVRFRYFSEDRDSIRTLLEVQAADLPGGAPTEDGYHSMKIKAVGNQFWLYWDGQEIPGSPLEDPEAALDAGYFGVYVWNAFGAEAPAVKVDDVVIAPESAPTSVKLWQDAPTNVAARFDLMRNYPNPFNPDTHIPYRLSESGHVSLTIYDMLGRTIRNVVSENQQAGLYSIAWDATDNFGQRVPSGVYVYTLRQHGQRISHKMLLMK